MEKTLISGGAGFIGSFLCEYFVKQGHYVICMDNLSTGNKDNLDDIWDHHYFAFIEHDVCEPFTFDPEIVKIDNVFHFASPASPIDFPRIPLEIAAVNSAGTFNMLEIARNHDARFMFASTSECYGDPQVHPQPETYRGNVNTIGVRGCYDESKRFGEAITMAYHRKFGIDTKIIRIFNTYGPRMPYDGRVLTAFINQIVKGEDLTVFGDGTQTRCFCYIDDMIDGIIKLFNSNEHEPINFGNQVEITINEFADRLLKISKTNNKVIYKPLPQDDPKQRRADITKAKTLFGWEPKTELDEGLRKSFDFFRRK